VDRFRSRRRRLSTGIHRPGHGRSPYRRPGSVHYSGGGGIPTPSRILSRLLPVREWN
jgi:hypothetical protein